MPPPIGKGAVSAGLVCPSDKTIRLVSVAVELAPAPLPVASCCWSSPALMPD